MLDEIDKILAQEALLDTQIDHQDRLLVKAREDLLVQQHVSELFKHLLQKYIYAYSETFSTLVTDGMQKVFEDLDVQMNIEVVHRRNKVAVDFVTTHEGYSGDVLKSFGGGIASIQSLLLRTLVLLKAGMSPYLFLDESLAALSASYVPNCATFLSNLCKEFGLNILLVTHQQDFIDHADHVYRAVLKGDEAKLEKLR